VELIEIEASNPYRLELEDFARAGQARVMEALLASAAGGEPVEIGAPG
jgi:hypothetical protein